MNKRNREKVDCHSNQRKKSFFKQERNIKGLDDAQPNKKKSLITKENGYMREKKKQTTDMTRYVLLWPQL